MESWRAKLGHLASSGVADDDPRVVAARAALDWHKHRAFMIRVLGWSPTEADSMLDAMDQAEAVAQ